MNSWIVAGLIAGVVVYLVDWVVWSKVFNTAGVAAMGGHMTPEERERFRQRMLERFGPSTSENKGL